MKVLFLQNIKSVAQIGDIKDVADGYARNYLFPRGLAALASTDSIKQSEQLKAQHAKDLELKQAEAKKVAEQIEGMQLSIETEANPEGGLYGSVSAEDIATVLNEKGFGVDADSINLETAIKNTGEYKITVELSQDVTATAHLTVSSKTA